MNFLLFFLSIFIIFSTTNGINIEIDGENCKYSKFMNALTIRCDKNMNTTKFPNLIDENGLNKFKEEFSFFLNNKQYFQIPDLAFHGLNIKSLDLSKNQIEFIEEKAFDGLGTILTKLVLSYNKLNSISFNLFVLVNLIELDLSNNAIRSIKNQTFKSLNKLKKLDLNSNNIRMIEIGSFDDLILVNDLNLDKNELNLFDRNLFSKLEMLSNLKMSENLFETFIADFSLNKKLEQISLIKNRLRKIEIYSEYEIKRINLFNNNLTHLNDSAFLNLKNLSQINLSSNRIQTITSNAFKSLVSIEFIFLNDNQLKIIEPYRFKHTTKLKNLFLDQNYIADIKHNAFKGLESSLESLDFTKNKLLSIKSHYFENLFNLKALLLDENQITTINKFAFRDLKNLNSLHLNNNFLFKLDSFLFLNLNSLTMLELANNVLINLEEDCFKNLLKLEHLVLNSNQLVQFQAKLPNLVNLNLGNNLIREIRIKTDFESKLTSIDLRNNKLKQISDDNFEKLTFLDTFFLNDNFDLKFFNLSRTRIRAINLKNNQNLEYLNLNWQSIENFIASNISKFVIEDVKFSKMSPFIDTIHFSFNNLSSEKLIKEFESRNYLNLAILELENIQMNTSLIDFSKTMPYLFNLNMNNNKYASSSLILSQLPYLSDLSLKNCSINDLNLNSNLNFSHSADLMHLYLSKNNLTIVKNVYFKYNFNLLYLYLDNNFIESIEYGSFSNNLNLNIMNLENNRLKLFTSVYFLSSNKLDNFVKLNLAFNQLVSYEFSFDASTSNLNLENNNLRANQIRSGMFKNIEHLNLNLNLIELLTFDMFSQAFNVRELFLKQNRLSSIENRTFSNMKFLIKLDLSQNLLNENLHNSSLFNGLVQLKYLNLSFNYLKSIQTDLFKDQISLEILDLSSNQIYDIHDFSFRSLNRLQEISLSSNQNLIRIKNNLTFHGLFSIRKIFISSKLIENNFLNTFNLKNSIQIRQFDRNLNVKYFYSINIISNLISFEFSDETTKKMTCKIFIFLIRNKIHFNLMSDLHINRFLSICENLTFDSKNYFKFINN